MVYRLFALSFWFAIISGCATINYRTQVTPVQLPLGQASHFYSNNLSGAGYIELKPDGTYTQITREHMGVWPFDSGTWSQNEEGVITFVSPDLCADVVSPPLEISVARFDRVAGLPEMKKAISDFLMANDSEQFEVDVYEPLVSIGERFKNGFSVDVDNPLERKFVSRAEIQKLISAIDAFLADPSSQNRRAIPMQYKNMVFLLWLNCDVSFKRELREIYREIDQSKPEEEILYYDFLITEAQFEKETRTPFPFSFYPEMNTITGAE